jgi:hypothetical protein
MVGIGGKGGFAAVFAFVIAVSEAIEAAVQLAFSPVAYCVTIGNITFIFAFATMIGILIQVCFATVIVDSIAIIPSRITSQDGALAGGAVGGGVGQGAGAAALVFDAATAAGFGGSAGPAVFFSASGLDGAAGSAELGAGFGGAATFVGNAATAANQGFFAISTRNDGIAAIGGQAAGDAELGA